MTCQHLLSLLEDYVDNDLSATDRARVSEHLDCCATCRAEYEAIRNLKGLLKRQPTTDPGQPYWSEVSSLILARTVEAAPLAQSGRTLRLDTSERTTFIRALVSAAVSVSILVAALFLGSGVELQQPVAVLVAKQPLLISSSLTGLVDANHGSIITRDEQIRLVRGLSLLGPPGAIGRFPVIPNLMTTFD